MVKELPVSQEQWEWLGQTLSRHANAKMAPDVIKLVMPGVRLPTVSSGMAARSANCGLS